jgi:CBS domain-containing protein
LSFLNFTAPRKNTLRKVVENVLPILEEAMGEKMQIGEICQRNVAVAAEDMSVKEAAELMRDRHVGSLVVVNETGAGRRVTGIVTDRDIAIVAVARDFDPQSLRVGDIMSPDPVTATSSQSVHDVLALMRERGIRRIPIITDDGALAGIVTLDDLLEVVADEMLGFAQAITSARKREARIRV